MKAFEGLTAEAEDYQEQTIRAHLGAILHIDNEKHRYFSADLMQYADPEFIPSPPTSPAWRRQKKKSQSQPRRKMPVASGGEEEREPPPEESRSLADMASFFEMSDDSS